MSAPDSYGYGFWIDPEGKFIPVSSYKHDRVARDELGFSGAFGAQQAGYIRVVTNNLADSAVEIEFMQGAPSRRALSACYALMRDVTKRISPMFFIDINSLKPVDGQLWHSKKLHGSEAIRYVRDANRPEALTETVIPETDYGYWIKPDGEILPVGYMRHIDVLRKHVKEPLAYPWEYGAKGWVRVVNSGPDNSNEELSVEFHEGTLTTRALSAIRKLARHSSRFVLQVINANYAENFERVSRFLVACREHGLQVSLTETVLFSDRPYGFWVSPEGDLHEVATLGHLKVIQRLGFSKYREAESQGWIKLTLLPGWMGIEFAANHLTRRGSAAVRRLAVQSNVTHFTCEAYDDTGAGPALEVKEFSDPRALHAHLIRHHAQMKQVASVFEGSVPPTTYGYWIKPTGEIIPVTRYAHREAADEVGGVDAAVEAGWVKITLENTLGDVEMLLGAAKDAFNRRVRGALRQICKANPAGYFLLEFPDEPYEEFRGTGLLLRRVEELSS